MMGLLRFLVILSSAAWLVLWVYAYVAIAKPEWPVYLIPPYLVLTIVYAVFSRRASRQAVSGASFRCGLEIRAAMTVQVRHPPGPPMTLPTCAS
jgi:hypothetical protein